ncbi:MAG: stage sporulation protein [Clostridiales bacterium]|nr:stage sporulation protein [Clostridiales bacterium]
MEKKKLNLKEIGMDKVVIIFAAGIFLLVLSLPSMNKTKVKNSVTKDSNVASISNTSNVNLQEEYISWMEERLAKTIRKMQGVSDAEVMITLQESSEKVVLKDSPFTQENSSREGNDEREVSSSASREDETVLVEGENSTTSPYVLKEIEPEVEGVLVLVSGNEDGVLESEIVDAIEVLFHVPAHKIKVMKMKSGAN